jgi:hypothetical protein
MSYTEELMTATVLHHRQYLFYVILVTGLEPTLIRKEFLWIIAHNAITTIITMVG